MDYNKLAEMLFPNIDKSPADYEKIFPKRKLPEGAIVTRLGPSPTGFIHLGNLYGAFVDERLAHLSGGIFYLRIEDTDDKRYVDGAVETIINSLKFFGLHFDEGASLEGSIGDYGPYMQSERKEIYQCFAKEMIRKHYAYPCFMTEDEISDIRAEQETAKMMPGIYGKYARYRNLSIEDAEKRIADDIPYVIRLRSTGNHDCPPENMRQISIEDGIRGTLNMPENTQDIVLLKANGIPTYHFAHAVDDHLMRTTHIVRGEEWLSSLPIHIELFEKLGFELPVYCHTAQLMKLDENGNKRKLSKSKDPELSLDFYREKGYHPAAIREYLLTILNSNYEEWRTCNPDTPSSEFPFTISKMSNSGALFDLNKLDDVSKDVLVKIAAADLYKFFVDWALEFDPDIADLIKDKPEYVTSILNIGRSGKKPRKDFFCADKIFKSISYFFDETFKIEDELPEQISTDDCNAILDKYLETYEHSDSQENWFEKIRNLGEELGYAGKPKNYKKHPEDFKGHVGHVSTAIRIALTGRSQSPDIWEIQQVMGEKRTRKRIEAFKLINN